jgi:hypothetical protein
MPLPSLHANCPRCANLDLTILKKRDRIDKLNRNPLRLMQRALGARLYHCWRCRLQFYDLRRPAHFTKSGTPGVVATADRSE